MAEEERVPSFSEKDGTDTSSQSKDTYIPEEPTPDISVSLLDIQMPETPDSTKGQISDGDTSRLESPKTVKPVLGKVQAKKRLMAFAKFKALPKSQVKPNLSQHSSGALKTKDKTIQDDTSVNKSRKKTEEKILAIEEIRREESKSKMLLAEAMAAASMEDESHTGKNTSSLFENTRRAKEKNKREGLNDDRKNRSSDRKYSERHRHRDKIEKDSSNQDVKDRNGSTERSTQKSSQDREKHKKDKKKKNHKDKRENKIDVSRDKKEEGKDKKENGKEKQDETREKTETTKTKKENTKEKRNDTPETEAEGKDKRDKDKRDKWKEKVLLKSNSWAEVRKFGLTLDDVIYLRRRVISKKSVKIKPMQQDYTRYLEQMLMLSNHRLKRQALIAEGLHGSKKYPPESIRLTKRTKGLQLSYCENPRVSLLLGISQLLEAVTPERREKIRDICEASLPRIDTEDTVQQKRNWYQQINAIEHHKDTTWQVTTVQLPKSKWDSEDEETLSASVAKEVENPANKLQVFTSQQEIGSTTSSVTDEDKIDNTESTKEENKSSEKTIKNLTPNDEVSTSSSLQPAGNEKLASEYEQFMKMVCTTTDVTKEYSPNRNLKSASPCSYHEFNIESNLAEDNTNMEIPSKEKFDKKDKLQILEGSIKSTECEESTQSTDCQIQVDENIQIENGSNENDDESEDSKSIPSDWENVRIKVERLSDENTESREVKKKKKQKKLISSSDSSSSTTSDSEKEKKKKKRKRKRKVLSNSSSSDSDSTDSSSSSSDSSSSEQRKKRKRKRKKIGKKRKKVKRIVRIKKKRRRKVSTDSNSSDSDELTKKKKRAKKKTIEAKSINNGDISKISKSPPLSSDGTKSQSVTPGRKIKEEVASEDRKRSDQIVSTKKIVADTSVLDSECLKQKKERKDSKSDESFMEQWEIDSVMTVQQNDGDTSSQDRTGESEKMDGLEKSKYRMKRKHSRDNVEQDKDRESKANEERIHEGKAKSDEEVEVKRKKRKEKDSKSSTEFLANWERESDRITQQIMQNDSKYLKKLGKQKKQRWGETDFDTLNVPSLTQLEKEVCQKQLLADEWEVDSLEAISDLIMSKRKSSLLKKVEKEVRYDKKTDTYIAIEKEKENVREMKKRQERLCSIRIWEEEQEEGEREEMMLQEQKSKRRTEKTDDWDIEEESHFRTNTEQMEVCNDIVTIENEWTKTDEVKNIKEDTAKLIAKPGNKRVKKSRWDMGSHSEEKSEIKDIWEEEYVKWSKKNKCEQELNEIKKRDSHATHYSENSSKSNLIDLYHRKPQSRELLDSSWAPGEIRLLQAKNDSSVKHLISVNDEQLPSIKEHQTREQLQELSKSDVKFKEKIVELYSPSSPALSQKSQDVEISNESSSCNSLLHEKRKKEMLITADKLSIPMSDISLQLTKLRDTKHTSNEKIENILNKAQEDKDSANNFDIKTADNLFDDISINEPCPKVHVLRHMDMFAEYGLDKASHDKQHVASNSVSSATCTKSDEVNETKNALKLIPKQLLIRRNINEQVKSKRILETPLQDPAQHAAALLTIQKKLLESHALKNDIKEYPNEKQVDHFEQRCNAASNSGNTENALLDATEFSVVSKSSIIATRQSRSPASEQAVSIRSEQSENYDRENKNDDVKKYKTNRNDTSVPSSSVRSPVREHRRRSPNKKESEKRYLHDKDKKERKSDDAEKSDRRGSKADSVDRRKLSPSERGRRRRSGSPYVSWERQRSRSGSPGHSWSRSRSKSPKRKDEVITRDRDKKRERYEDERSARSRTDERKERYARSPPRFSYNEDNFKKHGASSKNNRDDWGRRRHDNVDRDHEKDTRSYDPMEILRERTNLESEKYRDNRFRTEELDHTFWQCTESGGILRDSNESMDSYTVEQDLPLEYDDRTYYREGSLERDVASPQLKYRRRFNTRRERQWERDKDSSDLDRHGHRSRNRTPPRSRYSPARQVSERFRRKSRSHSRSWSPLRSRTRSRSRSGSRSRSTSRSRPRIRSQSRSRSRSPFDIRSRGKSASTSKLRSPEHAFRMSELRPSRSPSPGRDRLNERERKDNDESKKFNACSERGRRIETIVQSGIMPGPNILDTELAINSNLDGDVTNFQYSNEIEGGNEYYYTENNLTYPPCIDESSTSSPKRLSLDDRLELELGIKKQHSKDSTGVASEYSNFNPNVIVYPSPPPPQQQQQMMYRQQPTVVQVGNVLQVVPADFNGVQSARREIPAVAPTPPVRSGSSQVVRVGNVLQVVPTSLDWSSSSSSGGGGGGGGSGSGSGNGSGGSQSTSTDQSNGVLYSSAAHSPSVPSVSMSVPVPVPVPLPVPPAMTNTLASVTTMSPVASLPLSLPVPVPLPVPISPATTATFPRNEIQPQKIVQPVYNYEAILETRRKEREERKRLRELRRKERERKRIERVNRRALRLLEKSSTSRQTSGVLLDHRKGSIVDLSVIKALKEGEEQTESPSANPMKEDEEVATPIKEEDEDAAADEEEDDDDDEVEAEAEDDEEEEEEAEDEDEDDDDDEKPLQIINQRVEADEAIIIDANKDQMEIEAKKEWPELPPPPLKGILVVPGFRRDAVPNGNLDDLLDDITVKDGSDKDEEIVKNNECDKDAGSDVTFDKSNSTKPKKTKKTKKSVQFADGVKPGEGTSPSGGEGDMPSPPPPQGIGFREGFSDLRREKMYSSRKRKQEKRTRPQKAKKKVKVKIIKLKKPRITPLTAMMMDDSDEMDDRSPPPPPPGSPPPPHLWPSYLSIYNTTMRAIEQSQTTTVTLTPVQAPPPPTPLPLLIPPPPLNYTIQPCSKS
ncbi:uncharacterized protein LOC105198112 isoform X1 [Solenopsis invicta]|uniref:uncharacterized protein LOC105198112 isoform X1 n=1 Tax=Solenopsis invicta TaxID=13686 RepID=UPI000E33E2D8|nr:uncharacterized protein LOC105198112 isoform X1 [Solenopsis invicta]